MSTVTKIAYILVECHQGSVLLWHCGSEAAAPKEEARKLETLTAIRIDIRRHKIQ